MDIASAAVGGAIGIASSIVASYYSFHLGAGESYRKDLALAYSTWSGRLVEALDEWSGLMRHDEILRLKKSYTSGLLQDVPANPVGRPREDIARRMLETRRDLQIATSNLLMLEPEKAFADRVQAISTLIAAESDKIGYYQFEEQKRAEMNELLRDICSKHPVLARRSKQG